MSEEKEFPEISSYMTAVQTGPRADRRQINLAFVDDAVNLHPDQKVCRQGEMVSLIDWLDHGFEPHEKSVNSVEHQRATYWGARASEMSAVVKENTTFYVEMDERHIKMFRTLINDGAELEAIQRLAFFMYGQLKLPSNIRFIPWATYVRVGKVSKFLTHKTMDMRDL